MAPKSSNNFLSLPSNLPEKYLVCMFRNVKNYSVCSDCDIRKTTLTGRQRLKNSRELVEEFLTKIST
jgi:hypothetical protein